MKKNKTMYCMECKEVFFTKNTNDTDCTVCGAPEIETLDWKELLRNNDRLPEEPEQGIKYDIF